MKPIFRRNYETLKILVILALAAMLILMLTSCGSLPESKEASSNTLNVELNDKDSAAVEAFVNAVEKLPNEANLEYKHKSLLEDTKKKYSALSEEDGAKHSETLENAQKRYNNLSEEEKQKAEVLRAEIAYKALREKFSNDFIMIESLITLGKGMLGIFIVMGIIIGAIYLLNYAGKRRNNLKEKIES